MLFSIEEPRSATYVQNKLPKALDLVGPQKLFIETVNYLYVFCSDR